MNTWLKKTAKWAVLSMIVACGGNTQDPATYNNELMTTINSNEQHITDMNAAMNAGDYDKASEVRKTWEEALKEQQEKVENMGDFDGDNSLQQGVLAGLAAYQKIVKEDYVKLIEIRSQGVDDAAAETTALNNINNAFEEAANAVNEAGAEFEKKYANPQ